MRDYCLKDIIDVYKRMEDSDIDEFYIYEDWLMEYDSEVCRDLLDSLSFE